MTAAFPLFLIPLLPLVGAAFCLLLGRRAGNNLVTLVALGSVASSALVTLQAVFILATRLPPGGSLVDSFFAAPWLKAGELTVSAGLVLDHLSAILCLVVTVVGFLIHVYSTAYMEHDPGYARFFGYLNLFTGAMLILVLGDSMPVTFVGWEGVGLCSYLLIGFWFDKEQNAYAGRKAFVVNRIGDFGFLLAMFLTFNVTGTLKFGDFSGHLDALRLPMWFGWPAAYFIGLLVLLGAIGKSAQIPLYVWLPDAMAGPTPVSALIHAATMVTAGVYMVARMHVVFESAPPTLAAVAGIGAATALFAAIIGIAQRDLKKVLAYSTISQLGFMFAAAGSYVPASRFEGTSNYQAAIFHLVTHAFFKAGLFLGAGSVMHALANEGDIFRMGGLKRHLPHTRWTFLICCLAIAGIPPLSGFWSKDAILAGAFDANWLPGPATAPAVAWLAAHFGQLVYFVLLAAAGCTAFYMFRLYFLVFEGDFRGHAGPAEGSHAELHESPPAMTVVLWILAAGAVVIGWLGIPGEVIAGGDHFAEWLSPVLPAQAHEESASRFWLLAGIAVAVSAAGIGLAALLYGHGVSSLARNLVARLPRLHRLVANKFYVDEIYDRLVVRPFRYLAIVLWQAVDAFVIDLVLVNGVAFFVGGVGKLVRLLQSGDVQRYVVGVLVGAGAIVYVALNYTAQSAAQFDVRVEHEEVTVMPHGAAPTAGGVEYRVDWDGTGKFSEPTDTPVLRYRYASPGKHRITVESLDRRWRTRARSSQVVTIP